MGLFKPAWMTNTKNYAKAQKIAASIYNKETDQRKLAEISKNAPNDMIRQAAIEKLSDVSILADLAQNDVRADTRLRAVNMLSHWAEEAAESQAVFEHIAKNERDKNVREAAVYKLYNQSLLVDIIKNERDERLCTAAVSRLTERTAIDDIARNGRNYKIRSIAIKKLVGIEPVTMPWQAPQDFVSAIDKISDSIFLEDIANNTENKQEKRAAIIRLFILSGNAKAHEGNHKWEFLDCCLKRCTICGALEHDHKYERFNFSGSEFNSRADFRCEKCGDRAERLEAFSEIYDTREHGLVQKGGLKYTTYRSIKDNKAALDELEKLWEMADGIGRTGW